jgi:hypothetical protein
MLDFNKILKEDTLGVVVCATPRIDFFTYATKIVKNLYSSKDLGKFEKSKAYVVGTHKGVVYQHIFFVKTGTPTFEYFEGITNKVNALIKD